MLHQVKPDDALKAAREAVVPWLMELIEDGYRRIQGVSKEVSKEFSSSFFSWLSICIIFHFPLHTGVALSWALGHLEPLLQGHLPPSG